MLALLRVEPVDPVESLFQVDMADGMGRAGAETVATS